jgi:hypothetical protein
LSIAVHLQLLAVLIQALVLFQHKRSIFCSCQGYYHIALVRTRVLVAAGICPGKGLPIRQRTGLVVARLCCLEHFLLVDRRSRQASFSCILSRLARIPLVRTMVLVAAGICLGKGLPCRHRTGLAVAR